MQKKVITFDEFVNRVKKYLRAILTELKTHRDTIKRIENTVNGLKSEVDTLKAKIMSIEHRISSAPIPVEKPTPATTTPPEIGVDLESILPELPTPPTALEEKPAEESVQQISIPAPPTPPPSPQPSQPQPQPTQTKQAESELSDLDKYLEKLDKLEIPEAPPIEDISPAPVPEMAPDSGEEEKTVSPDELKKKEKEILEALSEIELA